MEIITQELQDAITPELTTKISMTPEQQNKISAEYSGMHFGEWPTYKILPINIIENLERNRSVINPWAKKVLGLENGFNKAYCGAIHVALTPDGKYTCFDGNGRLTLAQITGETEIPCLITKMDDIKMAYYAYNKIQSTLVRNQHPNNFFIVSVLGGNDPQVQYELQMLEYVGLKVVDPTNSENFVSEATPTHGNINISAFRKLLKIAELDINLANWKNRSNKPKVDLIKNAVKLIRTYWSDEIIISKELLGGLVILLKTYPALTSGNGAQQCFEDFLKVEGDRKTQKKLSFKHDGGNQHNKEELSVANGIMIGIFDWKQVTATFKNQCPKYKIEDLFDTNV